MAARANTMFQGSDWITYRWTVAQVYDSLDCILALSVNQKGGPDRLLTDAENEVLETIADVCHDLSGEVMMAAADLLPLTTRQFPASWAMQEIMISLPVLSALSRPSDAKIFTMGIFDKIHHLASHIKDKLKKIDA